MKFNKMSIVFFTLLLGVISICIFSCHDKNNKLKLTQTTNSKTNEQNLPKECGNKARKYNLIYSLINDYNIGMSGPGKKYNYQFVEFPTNFNIDSNFEKKSGKPIILIKDYKIDTIQAMFLKFKKIFLNTNLDSAYAETDFYDHGRKNTSSEYYMKFDTVNCIWIKKNYEGIVY